MMSAVLLIRLFASPLAIGLASLAGKRWGPNIAGVLGGLPLVGGPIVAALWITQGSDYVTTLARSAPAGVWSNIVYMLAVGQLSKRWGWKVGIACGWIGYLGGGLLLNASGLAHSLIVGVAVLPGLWLSAVRWLPKPTAVPPPTHLPHSELITRMLAAAALVLSLTAAASWFGPTLTGLFTGAPVAATVIPAFTYVSSGHDGMLLALRGFLTGLMGFTVCFLILGLGIPVLHTWAVLPAIVAGVAVGFGATALARRVV